MDKTGKEKEAKPPSAAPTQVFLCVLLNSSLFVIEIKLFSYVFCSVAERSVFFLCFSGAAFNCQCYNCKSRLVWVSGSVNEDLSLGYFFKDNHGFILYHAYYTDWLFLQQAYSPIPPPGFLASSPQAHPYMWGVQVLMILCWHFLRSMH